jgi:hypothetical protein
MRKAPQGRFVIVFAPALADRALFIWLYRRCLRFLDAHNHCQARDCVGIKWVLLTCWRWKSPKLGGRPRIGKEVRYGAPARLAIAGGNHRLISW